MDASRKGLIAGVSAYLVWGLLPLYWPLLEPAPATEILAHRIAWSLLFIAALLAATTGFGWLRALSRRQVGLLMCAAVLVTTNWGLYIYGVNSKHVVETALGYFINPLVTVALAVVLLGERLNRAQWTAVAIAAGGCIVLTVNYGRPPWISLALAFSFGFYGLIKKRAGVDGVQSLAVETGLLFVPAVAYILFLQASGRGTFANQDAGHALLLAGGGVATAVPLMLFGVAAFRMPLSTLGLIQYLAPVMQFLIGVLIYSEPMPAVRLAGFACVWVALAIFSVDGLRGARSARVAARLAVAPEGAQSALAGRGREAVRVDPAADRDRPPELLDVLRAGIADRQVGVEAGAVGRRERAFEVVGDPLHELWTVHLGHQGDSRLSEPARYAGVAWVLTICIGELY
jgi:chloramphenicol-sensitive protein RarD